MHGTLKPTSVETPVTAFPGREKGLDHVDCRQGQNRSPCGEIRT